MVKILITEPEYFDKNAVAVLSKVGDVTSKRFDRKGLTNAIKDADAVVVRIDTLLDRKTLEGAKKLKVIGSVTTGLNHIDTEYASRRKIKIINLHGTHTVSTAEHTFALLLSLARKIPWAYESMKKGKWERYKFIGTKLEGKTIGIVGLGRIGVQVARYARAFGMTVIYYDPYVNYNGFRKVSLSHLLQNSDIVTVHAMLTKETTRLIGKKQFGMMKKSALFVNTARAEIIDGTALISALKTGVIQGAALDVFPGEPLNEKDKTLITYAKSYQNLILTPHIGASTKETVHTASLEIVRKVASEINKW